MGLRVFVALTVFAFGVGLFAVAAILFDRRRVLRHWLAERRVRAAARTNPGGGVGTVPAVTTLPLVGIIVGCLFLGAVLVFGSCAGLILW